MSTAKVYSTTNVSEGVERIEGVTAEKRRGNASAKAHGAY
jgi:hypothetical protein